LFSPSYQFHSLKYYQIIRKRVQCTLKSVHFGVHLQEKPFKKIHEHNHTQQEKGFLLCRKSYPRYQYRAGYIFSGEKRSCLTGDLAELYDVQTKALNQAVKRNIGRFPYEYVVNGKSAIEWIMERYAITTHKESGITNNPND
jgi:hypothetical protein